MFGNPNSKRTRRAGKRNPTGRRRSITAPVFIRRAPYLRWGFYIGLAISIGEPMLAALGDPDYWARVAVCHLQLLFAPLWLGLAIGYACSKRVENKRRSRHERGLCWVCGYNLQGNVSGTCPECGTPVLR